MQPVTSPMTVTVPDVSILTGPEGPMQPRLTAAARG